jgi:hypothetical protein
MDCLEVSALSRLETENIHVFGDLLNWEMECSKVRALLVPKTDEINVLQGLLYLETEH